jgi:hypothetical protein
MLDLLLGMLALPASFACCQRTASSRLRTLGWHLFEN